MRGKRLLVTIVGAISGVCFAALAARSLGVLVITPGHVRVSSIVFALIAGYFSYRSFRAATSGATDTASIHQAVMGGVAGAVAGLIIVAVAYAMFNQTSRAYFAHPLGLHFQQLRMGSLLVSLMCLGFGAGFALRMPTRRKR